MVSAALIFFMQIGFITFEAGATRKRHWSAIVMKNLLVAITGTVAFWLLGFGLAFGPTDSRGFIGIDTRLWAAASGWD